MAIDRELVERAMQLSLEDRAQLAHRLILSLESIRPDPGIESDWETEIERRIAEYERAESPAVDWREAVDRARATLRPSDPKGDPEETKNPRSRRGLS